MLITRRDPFMRILHLTATDPQDTSVGLAHYWIVPHIPIPKDISTKDRRQLATSCAARSFLWKQTQCTIRIRAGLPAPRADVGGSVFGDPLIGLLFPASLAAAGTRPQLSIQFFIALIEAGNYIYGG